MNRGGGIIKWKLKKKKKNGVKVYEPCAAKKIENGRG